MNIRFKKGLDLRLAGSAIDSEPVRIETDHCAIVPDDFCGFVPKMLVREGDEVQIGTPLMHDKTSPDLCLVSPVSGVVSKIERGERRKILKVEINNDHKYNHRQFDTTDSPLELLANSGLLSMVRRRPYDVVVRTAVRPRDIFVTALDTAPLAQPLTAKIGCDPVKTLAEGVKVLKTLTEGKLHISVGCDWAFGEIEGAEMHKVSGPHPAGNVGVQISAIDPVGPGQEVWALDIVTLYKIGQLMQTGQVDTSVTVAITGGELSKTGIVETTVGASVREILKGFMPASLTHNLRVISGNVLTGVRVSEKEGFLRYPYRQVTVIAEGDDRDEFMGWISFSPSKLSVSKSLPLSRLKRKFRPDARLCGGRRAMIMSGEYDAVLPMDIMVEYLLKAIISRNIEDMEALGIYEVAPEDLALCEFVDTSKLPIQQIVRDGLDFLRKETE